MKRSVLVGTIAAIVFWTVPAHAQTDPVDPVATSVDQPAVADPPTTTIAPDQNITPPTTTIATATTTAPPDTSTTTAPPTTLDLNDPVARSGCNEKLFDPDHRVRAEDLKDAIATMVARGVDLHVRVEAKTDGGADERMAQLERVCPGWVQSGDRAPKLLTLIVLPDDRQTGIYYGSEWYALGSQWQSIQSNDMNPRFREGDFTDGISAGLSSLRRVISGTYSAPYSAPSFNSRRSRSSGDRSAVGPFLLIVLLFVGIFGLNYLIYLAKGDSEGFGSYMAKQRDNNGHSSYSSFSSGSSSSSSYSSSSSGSSGGSSGGGSSSW